jgi:hypothetical protein
MAVVVYIKQTVCSPNLLYQVFLQTQSCQYSVPMHCLDFQNTGQYPDFPLKVLGQYPDIPLKVLGQYLDFPFKVLGQYPDFPFKVLPKCMHSLIDNALMLCRMAA